MNECIWGNGGITSTGDGQITGAKTSRNVCLKHFLPQKVSVELSICSVRGLRNPAYEVSGRHFVLSEAELELTSKFSNSRLWVFRENTVTLWAPHKALFTS